MLRGAVDWRVILGAAMVAGSALVLSADRETGRMTLLSAGLCLSAGWIVLQLIPIPFRAVEALSPNAARLFEVSLAPLGLYPAARPLSLDPGAGALEVGKAFACSAAAIAAVQLAQSRNDARRMLIAIASSGGAAAVAALLLSVFSRGDGTAAPGPFGNPNHLGGFLNLCCWPALGLAVQASARKRGYWLMCFGIAGSGVFLSLSRGGIGAFFAGLLIFLVLHLHRRRSGISRYSVVVAASGVTAVLALSCFAGLDKIVGKFGSLSSSRLSSVDKIAVWPVLLKLVARFPAFGIGRGAFATTFPVFKVEADSFTWTHAENEWLHIPIEIGVVAAIVLIASFAWIWIRAASETDLSSPRIGLLSGMAALALHNLVDFSFEVLGVALPFAVAAAIISRSDLSWPVPRKFLLTLGAVSVALSLAGVVLYRFHPIEVETRRLAAERVVPEAQKLALADIRWHPADYFPHLAMGALLAGEDDCSRALPWLSRAMWLNPTAPDPHFYTAWCLRKERSDRVGPELRLAYLFGRKDALALAVRRYSSLASLLRIVPDSADARNNLAALLADRGRFADAASLFKQVWEEQRDLVALARLGDVTLSLGDANGALQWSRLLREKDPDWISSYTVGSKALAAEGKWNQALSELQIGLQRRPGNGDLLTASAELLVQQQRFSEAMRALHQVLPRDDQETARIRRLISQTLEAQARKSEIASDSLGGNR